MVDYIRDGNEIYDRSFAIIRREAKLSNIPPDLEKLVVRVIHACGMTDIVDDIGFSPNAGAIGREALKQGASVLCDCEMVAHGITRARLPNNNHVLCTLNDASVRDKARTIKNTRSAAAVELWGKNLEGAVVVIGNAPTALFHLLDLLAQGAPHPALILGFPVGFVGAAESKVALASNIFAIPYVLIKGRRGGSAMAAAALNALAQERE